MMGPKKPKEKKPKAGNNDKLSVLPPRRPRSVRGSSGPASTLATAGRKAGAAQPASAGADRLSGRIPRQPAVPSRGRPAAARVQQESATPSKHQPARPGMEQPPKRTGPNRSSEHTTESLASTLPKEPSITNTQNLDQKDPQPLAPLTSFNVGGVVSQGSANAEKPSLRASSADLLVQRLRAISGQPHGKLSTSSRHGSQEGSNQLADKGSANSEMPVTDEHHNVDSKEWDCSIDSKEWDVDENKPYASVSKQFDCSIDSKQWEGDGTTESTEAEFRWGWDKDGTNLKPAKAESMPRDYSLVDLTNTSHAAQYKPSEEPKVGISKQHKGALPGVQEASAADYKVTRGSNIEVLKSGGGKQETGCGISRLFRRSSAGRGRQSGSTEQPTYVKPTSLTDAAHRVGRQNLAKDPDTGCGCF